MQGPTGPNYISPGRKSWVSKAQHSSEREGASRLSADGDREVWWKSAGRSVIPGWRRKNTARTWGTELSVSRDETKQSQLPHPNVEQHDVRMGHLRDSGTRALNATVKKQITKNVTIKPCRRYAGNARPVRACPERCRGGRTIESRIIHLQGKQVGLFPERHYQSGSATHSAQSPAGLEAQLPETLRAEVG